MQGPDPPRKDTRAPWDMAADSACFRCGTRCALAGSKTASLTDLPMRPRSPDIIAYTRHEAFPTWNTRSFTPTSFGRTALDSLVGTSTSGMATTTPRSSGGFMLMTSKGSYDLMMVNPPSTQGATLSAWNPPDVTSSACAAQSTSSVRFSFSPHRMCARYAPPAAEAPDEPIPLHGLIPFFILISIPKSASHLLRTSAAAIPTELEDGSRGMESDPGPETSVMTIPDSIFLPSMMS